MKKIGILGLGPHSSIEYYKKLIEMSQKKWDHKNPDIIIYNKDDGEWAELIEYKKDYKKAKEFLFEAIKALTSAGSDFIIMASNTPHLFYDELQERITIPMLSISDSIAKEAEISGYENVGLIGTKMTMNSNFYYDSFEDTDINLKVPDDEKQDMIHEKIVEELVKGIMKDETKAKLSEACKQFIKMENLDSLILGCTELPLILSEEKLGVPFLDTIEIHTKYAFQYCLSDE
ncbi:MAG: aspartate/glutamate racemase family protein [Thermoplasmata archaeon]